MQLESFLECVRQGHIPPEAPDGLTVGGHGPFNSYRNFWDARRECTTSGMWAIVSKDWVTLLAEWVDNRKVLEIMAGPGWLAKALLEEGVRIIPTDDKSWSGKHSKAPFLLPIMRMDCLEAVRQYPETDILLVSWPPYGDMAICKACEAWGQNRPVIYIGERDGGCNAPEEFFVRFQEIEASCKVPLMAWPGIHDYILIGHYGRNENESHRL